MTEAQKPVSHFKSTKPQVQDGGRILHYVVKLVLKISVLIFF